MKFFASNILFNFVSDKDNIRIVGLPKVISRATLPNNGLYEVSVVFNGVSSTQKLEFYEAFSEENYGIALHDDNKVWFMFLANKKQLLGAINGFRPIEVEGRASCFTP